MDENLISINKLSFGYGKADTLSRKYKSTYPAVTFAIAKKQGADAMQLSDEIINKIGSTSDGNDYNGTSDQHPSEFL